MAVLEEADQDKHVRRRSRNLRSRCLDEYASPLLRLEEEDGAMS
jgi:hypothetical protein